MYVAKKISPHEVVISERDHPNADRWLLTNSVAAHIGGLTTKQVGRIGLLVSTLVAILLLSQGMMAALSAVILGLAIFAYAKYVEKTHLRGYRRVIFYTNRDAMRRDVALINGRNLHPEVRSLVRQELNESSGTPDLSWLRRVADEEPDNGWFHDALRYADVSLRPVITDCLEIVPFLDAEGSPLARDMRYEARAFAQWNKHREDAYLFTKHMSAKGTNFSQLDREYERECQQRRMEVLIELDRLLDEAHGE